MGDKALRGNKLTRIGFSRAGPVGNLPWVRGTSRPGVKKAPRGAEHKEAIKQEKPYKMVPGAHNVLAKPKPRPHKKMDPDEVAAIAKVHKNWATTKKVVAGTVATIPASYAYGKWNRYKRRKKAREKKKDKE